MGTAGPHLGPPKSPTGRKAALHGPQRTRDQPQHPVPEENEEKEEDPLTGAVWIPVEDFKKLINLIYKRKFSLVLNLFKFVWYIVDKHRWIVEKSLCIA